MGFEVTESMTVFFVEDRVKILGYTNFPKAV